jgi:hypothetical protein
MVPALGSLEVFATTPDSFQVKIPGILDKKIVSHIQGVRIMWSHDSLSNNLVGSTGVINYPCDLQSIKNLELGKTYYVSACYVGKTGDGIACAPVCVQLAGKHF